MGSAYFLGSLVGNFMEVIWNNRDNRDFEISKKNFKNKRKTEREQKRILGID